MIALIMGAWIYLKTKLFELNQERRIRAHLYHHEGFKKADLALKRAYLGKNPYRMNIQYLKRQGADDLYTYGETPISTMAQIVHAFGISSSDRVIEMGAGRGRAALFLSEYIGCQVRAYEVVPSFIEKLKVVEAPKLEVRGEDMLGADFSWATVIFLYGTMLEDEEIFKLTRTFPEGAKILTVSYSLSEYSAQYQTKKVLRGTFPWGETEIYWNERTSKETMCPVRGGDAST